MFGVECKPKLNPLQKYYIRTGPVANAEDLKFYDPGVFNMCSNGAQTDYGAGQLWVSYQVAFYEPKLPDASTATGATTSVFPLQS